MKVVKYMAVQAMQAALLERAFEDGVDVVAEILLHIIGGMQKRA